MSDYNSLRRKYNNFAAPAFEIKLKTDAKEFSFKNQPSQDNQCIVSSISVRQSVLSSSASSLSFTIENCYDRENRKFNIDIKPEDKITASIGYGSALKEVFKGTVSEVEYNFSEYPVINITALDIIRTMLNIKFSSTNAQAETGIEIVNKIINSHSELKAKKIENLKYVCERNQNEYAFLEKIAELNKKYLLILLDDVYITESKAIEATPLMILEFGSSLLSFSTTVGNDKDDIYIKSKNKDNKNEDIESKKEKSSKTVNQIKADGNEDATVISNRAYIKSQKKIAAARTASMECIGMPEIQAGYYIKCSGLTKKFDSYKYYIQSVSHNFSDSGYSTSITIQGWE